MRARVPFAFAAASALAVLAACGQPSVAATPQPATPQPAPSPVVSDWPRQQTLTDWAERVETLGQRHPRSYSGVEIDLPGDALVVHRVPSGALDAAVRRLVPASVTVRLVDARYSQQRLAEVNAEVLADAGYWRGRGVELHSVGPRIGQCVVVGIGDPQRHGAAIVARYQGLPVCVEYAGEPAPLTAGP